MTLRLYLYWMVSQGVKKVEEGLRDTYGQVGPGCEDLGGCHVAGGEDGRAGVYCGYLAVDTEMED
jgi:hypothetical protein